MPVGAAIGAAGGIGSALIGSDASNTAASKQSDSIKNALAVQQQMFQTAKNTLDPFINAGTSVLPTLQDLLTPGKSADALSLMPGFNFASQYGTKSATNALAASGRASGGPLATAVSQFNNGLAQDTWSKTVNALLGLTGQGASAGSALAGNALNSGNSQAGSLTGIGNAQASGVLGSANALSGGVTGAANSAGNALLLSKLLGSNSGGGIYGPGTSLTPNAMGTLNATDPGSP